MFSFRKLFASFDLFTAGILTSGVLGLVLPCRGAGAAVLGVLSLFVKEKAV